MFEKGLRVKLISNWQQAYKSLAVWLPTLAVFVLHFLDAAMQTNLVPNEWLPAVIFISGFVGRIVKQPNIGIK